MSMETRTYFRPSARINPFLTLFIYIEIHSRARLSLSKE